jgi:hypothetical protein
MRSNISTLLQGARYSHQIRIYIAFTSRIGDETAISQDDKKEAVPFERDLKIIRSGLPKSKGIRRSL